MAEERSARIGVVPTFAFENNPEMQGAVFEYLGDATGLHQQPLSFGAPGPVHGTAARAAARSRLRPRPCHR
jgi:hypothetical protein